MAVNVPEVRADRELGARRIVPLLLIVVSGVSAAACQSVVEPESYRYMEVVTGGFHSCARTTEAQWFCWGHNPAERASEGHPSDGTYTRPSRLQQDPGLVALSAGEVMTCGLTREGQAYCWGRNGHGSLGLGFIGGEYVSPQAVATDIRFSALAAASTPNHMCGLSGGLAYCWGNNWRKQLGAGVDAWEHPHVEAVLGSRTYSSIAAGPAATCALTPATDLYCWGALVPGRENDLTEPELIAEETGFDTLVAGNGVRCGLRGNKAFCHGINTTGALGVGDTEPHEGLVPVAGDLAFRELSVGRVHACGITVDHRAYCWGSGEFGRLGNGTTDRALAPVAVAGDHRFQAISAGGEHTCGVTTAGEVYCWGRGYQGQLGNGGNEDRFIPTLIAAPID